LANDLARKSAEDTAKAAIASAKFEGDYNRIMTAPPAAGATPPNSSEPAPAEAPNAEKSGEEQQKEAPKN